MPWTGYGLSNIRFIPHFLKEYTKYVNVEQKTVLSPSQRLDGERLRSGYGHFLKTERFRNYPIISGFDERTTMAIAVTQTGRVLNKKYGSSPNSLQIIQAKQENISQLNQ